MIRAAGLASSTGLSSGGVESGGFWEGKARSALQALLHAAAIEQLSTRALFEWSLSASAAADAVGILASHPQAAPGWADALEGMINSDPRTRDSIWMAVGQALASLADPAVLDAVSPEPGEEFDPRAFLEQNGTLYLLATGAGAGASWPLVAAFIEDLAEVARHLAAASPGARLDPPLLLALDEIGNLVTAPLAAGPDGRRRRHRHHDHAGPAVALPGTQQWGDHAASTIWDASIVKVILGGASASRDLQELSVLIGERDERSDTGHHRRLRRPLAPAVDSAGAGHAARTHPHPAVRHRPRAAPQRAADRRRSPTVEGTLAAGRPRVPPARRRRSSLMRFSRSEDSSLYRHLRAGPSRTAPIRGDYTSNLQAHC